MTITINDVLALSNFIERHRNDQMSMKTAFKLNKLATFLAPDLELFRSKYSELVQQYGESNEEEGVTTFSVRKEFVDEFVTKVNELSAVEVDAPNVKFSLDELENFTCTFEEARPLMPFIED